MTDRLLGTQSLSPNLDSLTGVYNVRGKGRFQPAHLPTAHQTINKIGALAHEGRCFSMKPISTHLTSAPKHP
jgi:hypothetical protein